MDAVTKMTLTAGEAPRGWVPAMKTKLRMCARVDADVESIDGATVMERSTYR